MSETNFDNLPREVVENILDYVDLSELQRLRLVSTFWDRNISGLYGAIVTVHNANLEFILDTNACHVKAYFQSLTLPIPMNDSGTYFLDRLTSLTFSGLVVCYNVFPVLEVCMHVRKLDLILFNPNPKMKEYQVNVKDPSKLLPALRALSIRFDYEPFSESNFTFLKKLLPFFTSEKGKLDSIVLDCPDQGGPLEITFDKIFKKNSFQQRRQWDSRDDRLFDEDIPDEFYSELIISNFQTLRTLELADGKYRSRTNMKIYGKIETGSPEVQFTEFEQTMYSYLKTRQHIDHFVSTGCITLFELLKPQIHLKKLSIVILSTFTLDQIFLITDNNFRTLTSLTINYGCFPLRRRLLVLDAISLSKLAVLKIFEFVDFSYKKPVGYQNVERFARIINLNSLPTSLRVFSTSASLQFEQEADFNMTVFERLENLKTFGLLALPFFQFGKEEIYKMDSIKIRQLITWTPSLTKLVLRNSRILVPQMNEQNLELWPRTDSLPNSALDWFNDETYISVQKLPIDFGSPISYGNPNLIGQHSEWDWNQIRSEPYDPAADNEFPVRFDANILMDSEFRQRSTLLD